MGGHIAGVYAARYGDTLSSVVLCCPAGINSPEVTEFIQESRVNHPKGNLLLPQNAKEMKEMLKEVLYHDIKLPDQIAAALVKLKEQRMHVYKKGKKFKIVCFTLISTIIWMRSEGLR